MRLNTNTYKYNIFYIQLIPAAPLLNIYAYYAVLPMISFALTQCHYILLWGLCFHIGETFSLV